MKLDLTGLSLATLTAQLVHDAAAASSALQAGDLVAATLALEDRFGSVKGALSVAGLRVEYSAAGWARVHASRATLSAATVVLGGTTFELGALQLDGVELTITRGAPVSLAAQGATLDRLSATVRGQVRVAAEGVALGALLASGPTLRVESARATRIEAHADDLGAALHRQPAPAAAKPAAAKPASGVPVVERLRAMLGGFLDRLEGRLDVDVHMDVTLPILGVRRAVHHLRLPVERGAISFEKLESDLSVLESAVLDFEVANGRLILEKDIPLVPFDEKTLVEWHLAGDDLGLARDQRRVRLATLLSYQVAPELRATGQRAADPEAPSPLRRLDLDPLDVAFVVRGGAPVDLGAAGRVVFGRDDPAVPAVHLGLTGAYRAPLAESPDTRSELTLKATDLLVHTETLRLARGRTLAGVLRVAQLERAVVQLQGNTPGAASLVAHGVVVEGLGVGAAG